MPTVHVHGREIECEPGAVLRDVLCEAGATPHNGRAALLNCRGHGTCETFAGAGEGEGERLDGPRADATLGPAPRPRRRVATRLLDAP